MSTDLALRPSLDRVIDALRAALPELRQRYPVASLVVFGSWARGEQRADSDLDLAVRSAATSRQWSRTAA